MGVFLTPFYNFFDLYQRFWASVYEHKHFFTLFWCFYCYNSASRIMPVLGWMKIKQVFSLFCLPFTLTL